MGAEQSTQSGPAFTLELVKGGLKLLFKDVGRGEVLFTVANKCLDFFEEIDTAELKRVALVVISRLGKAILEKAETLTASQIADMIDMVSNVGSIACTATAAGISRATSAAATAALDISSATTSFHSAISTVDEVVSAGTNFTNAATNTVKVLSGVGGGLGIAFGLLDVGLGIHALVNGNATSQQLQEIQNLMAYRHRNNGSLSAQQRRSLEDAKGKIDQLAIDVNDYSKGTNITKISGGALASTGGGLAIAGIFFPPLLLPAAIVGGIGGAASITATICQLAAHHQKKLQAIIEELQKNDIYLMESRSQ